MSVSGNELAVGVNTVTIKVTAANGATKSYTIDATRQQDPNYKPSTDASIAALTLEGATLSPAFTSTVTDYIAYVPYETKQVTIAATAKDEKAQGITGTGEVRLSATEAETVLTVTGTAEDGKTKQNYTIHVLRMPAYTGIVPTVEVIDPATIPEVPPLEIPGTIAMPLIGEVKTVYVAIAAAVLLVAVLFLLGFLIGRGHTGGGDDEEYDDEPPRTPAKPLIPEERHTARVPRLVPREESSDSEPAAIPDKTPAAPMTPAARLEERRPQSAPPRTSPPRPTRTRCGPCRWMICWTISTICNKNDLSLGLGHFYAAKASGIAPGCFLLNNPPSSGTDPPAARWGPPACGLWRSGYPAPAPASSSRGPPPTGFPP